MAEDIKQQIADGARPLAKVGDVIQHGHDIPGNVAALRDRSDDIWRKNVVGTWDCFDHTSEPYGRTYSGWPLERLHEVFKTLRVVEVDPEPQPAERRCSTSATHNPHTWVYAPGTAEATTYRCDGRPKCCGMVAVHLPGCPLSGPVTLSLPQVPDGAVALVGTRSGWRWLPYSDDGWQNNQDPPNWSECTFPEVLAYEGSVTVEFAPPREPRTWPKLDGVPDDLRAFTGASGKRYKRHQMAELDRWHAIGDPEDWRPLAYWQQVDGPLTEVLT